MNALGIIAGGGRLPALLIEHCRANHRPFFVLAFEDAVEAGIIADVPHAVVRIGAVGEALEHLKKADVKEIVMAGGIKRPSMFSLRPDATGAKLLARLGAAFFAGDDALLKAIISFLETEGFKVIGSNDILGGLLAPSGVMGKIKPDKQALADIAQGMECAKKLGAQDIGQAVIIENGALLGVEDAQGTDALIERCAKLKHKPQAGVLVKARKPYQEGRVDLPTIGMQTVEKIHASGFCGIAVEADGSIVLDKEKLIAKADALGVFVVGVRYE